MNHEIVLSAGLADDLTWIEEQKEALEWIAKGCKIIWEIDLGIDSFSEAFTEKTSFQLRAFALETFCRTIWAKFQKESAALVLARTNIHRMNDPRDECEIEFEHLHEPFRQHLQAITLFSDYIYRLASFLPEELPVICKVDAQIAHSKAEVSVLLSKERFRHILLDVEGWMPKKGNIGCVIPEDGFCTSDNLAYLEIVFEHLKGNNIKLVPEALLNEEWDGLDVLILVAPALSVPGKRKAQGFAATGGEIVVYGGKTGITDEKHWDAWVAR